MPVDGYCVIVCTFCKALTLQQFLLKSTWYHSSAIPPSCTGIIMNPFSNGHFSTDFPASNSQTFLTIVNEYTKISPYLLILLLESEIFF